jgi:hypothetical protein
MAIQRTLEQTTSSECGLAGRVQADLGLHLIDEPGIGNLEIVDQRSGLSALAEEGSGQRTLGHSQCFELGPLQSRHPDTRLWSSLGGWSWPTARLATICGSAL